MHLPTLPRRFSGRSLRPSLLALMVIGATALSPVPVAWPGPIVEEILDTPAVLDALEGDEAPSRTFALKGVPGIYTTPIGSANVRMNNPSGDADNEVQSAVQVAASQNRVVACWFDSRGLNTPATAPPNTLVGYGWSTDYGQTWTDGGNMPRLTADSQVQNARLTSDGQGSFYLTARITTNLSGTNGTAIGLWKGTFTGSTFAWGAPTLLNALSGTTEILDNPFVVVAPGSPVVYVAWTRYMTGLTQGRIEIIRSDDGGTIWTSPVTIDQNYVDRRPGHVRLAIGSAGEVYAVWQAWADFTYFYCLIDDYRQATQPIYFSRSVDSGATWVPPITVMNQGVMGRIVVGPGEIASFDAMTPALAVDTSGGSQNGTVYVTAAQSAAWTLADSSGTTLTETGPDEWPTQPAGVLLPNDDATGTWTATSDNDYWAIDLVAGQNVFLHLSPPNFTCPTPNGMSTTMRLYAADVPLADAHPDTLLANQVRTTGTPTTIQFACQRTGRYYIRVFTGSASALNLTYRLRTRLVTWATPTPANPERDAKEVVLCVSTNQGSSWSQPIRVNDSPAGLIESQSSVVTDETGIARIFWHDRREGVLSPGLVNQAQPSDVFMASYSGTTPAVAGAQRLSDQSGAFAGISRSTAYPGNFNGAWQAGGRLYMAWADGRSRSSSGGTSVDAWLNVLDFYAPQTSITSGPVDGTVTNQTSTTFFWSGTDSVSASEDLTYSWSINGGDFTAPSADTMVVVNTLLPGTQTFRVRAHDEAGNIDSMPAERSWIVDTTPPVITVDAGPAEGSSIDTTSVLFSWHALDETSIPANVLYRFVLDDDIPAAEFDTTRSVTLTGLAETTHTFRISAIDEAGNIATLIRTFSINDAADVSWINAAGGNWNVGANWNTGTVPDANDRALITLDGTYTVTLNTNPTLAGLVVGRASGANIQTLSATARTITLNGASTIDVRGQVILNASIVAGSATIANAGELRLHGSTAISIPLSTSSSSLLKVQGLLGQDATPTMAVGFINAGTIEFSSLGGWGSTLTVASGTLTNAPGGVINVLSDGAGPRTLTATLDNQGTLNVLTNLAVNKSSAAHLNSGTINVTGGNLTVSQHASLTTSGTVTVNPGRSLILSTGSFHATAGTLGGGGICSLTNLTATFAVSTADLSLTGTGCTIAGAALVAAGRNWNLTGCVVNASLDVQGTLVSQGSTNVNGALSTTAGSLIRVEPIVGQSATLTVSTGFTNNGTIEIADASGWPSSLIVTSGTLTNAPGGVISNPVASSTAQTLTAALDNQGTVNILAHLLLNKTSAVHLNSGTINVTGGNLTVSQHASLTSSGTVTINPGRSLILSTGSFNATGGTLGGGGACSLTSLAADFSVPTGDIDLTGSGCTIAGAVLVGAGRNWNLTNCAVSASLDVLGTLLTQGTTSVSGALITSPGSIIRIEAIPGNSATLSVSTGFTNNGTIEISSPLGWPSSLVVSSGTLTNAPGGVIGSLPAGSGSRTLTAELDNQGTLELATGLVVDKSSADHRNSGTINVTGGNLVLTQAGTTPSFTNSGLISISGTRSLSGSGGAPFVNDTTGVIQGTGTFDVTGMAFSNSGTVNPGASPGQLTVTGAFPQSSSGNLNIELGGLTAGTTYDRLAVSGAATLDGAVNLSLVNGFTPSPGDSFRVVTAASVNGTPTYTGLGVGLGLVLEPRDTGDGITLHVVMDANAPETILVLGPIDGSVSSSTSATFGWTGSDLTTSTDSLTYSWSLDGAPFTPDLPDTTVTLTSLAGGAHSFRVRAHDTDGRIDISPAQRTWTVDVTGPVVVIDSGPAAGGSIDTVDVSFAWHATDNLSGADSLDYSWQLDAGAASPFDTTRSTTLVGLSEAAHTLVVRARDQVGNIGTTSRLFTVDLTEPQTTILTGPADGGATNTLNVSFSWSGTDAVVGLTFSTRMDEGAWSAFTVGTSGSFDFGSSGAHAFYVRARDAAGNIDATPASRAFIIDQSPPVVAILAGVIEGALLDTNIVSFSWTGSDDETPRSSLLFSSTIDAIPFGSTSVDSTRTITGLGDGLHTFRVRSQDMAGNTSTPATRSFTVDNLPPSIVITGGPMAGSDTNDTTAAFTWNGLDLVSADSTLGYQWRLDGGVYTPFDTTRSALLVALTEGIHTFEVRVRDQVLKIGSAARSWTVDLTPPTINTPTIRLQDGSNVQVTMTGSDDRILNRFHLQVATDIGFANVVQESDVSPAGLFTFTGNNGSSYFARAYSIDGAGNESPYSSLSNGVTLAFLPDLMVSSVLVPPSANSGQTIQLTWQVTNTGAGPTQVPLWHDDVFLSVGPTFNVTTSVFLGRFENTAYLAAGEAYATTRQVTLPRGASGLHYLHVRTDNLEQQSEDSGSNNTGGSGGFTILLSDFADLRTTSVVVPPTAFSGDPITVQWSVRNQGSGRTDVDQWWDTVFLSPDSTLGLTFQTGTIKVLDLPLMRFRHLGALERDSTYTRTESITLPQGINGNYWIIVFTDIGVTAAGQTVPEDGEVFENVSQFNNWNNMGIATTLTPPANLVVTSVMAPASINAGVPFGVSWNVLNNGLNPTFENWWLDRLFLSTNTTLEEGTDLQLASVPHTRPLERDSSYTAMALVTLPKDTQGPFHFLVMTDRSQSVVELSESDNLGTTASPSTVTVPPWPDLRVTDVTAPPSAISGTPIHVTWRVLNDGAMAAGGSWYDQVILSTSPVSATGTVLGTFVRPNTLPAGMSYSITGTFTTSASLSGTYYVHVRTDFDNRLFEHTDEGNNTNVSSGLDLTPYPAVDLQVSMVSGPVTAHSGASAIFQWTTSNIGVAATLASSWRELVYLSADTTLGGGDLLLSSNLYNGVLAAGSSVNRLRNEVLPNGLSGTYYVIVRADPDRYNATETQLANNIAASSSTTMIELTPAPDLVASTVIVPAMATAGQPMTVQWTTTNGGTGPTVPAAWEVSLYLSTNQYLDISDISLGTFVHNGVLAAGGFVDESFGVELPIYTSGAYYVIVVVDRTNGVYEAGAETNQAQSVVNIILPPPADLVVTNITVPPTAEPGIPLTISWTVENQGSNPAVGQMRDGIYISADTTFSPDAPMVGIRTRYINLAPGAAASFQEVITLSAEQMAGLIGSITGPLPGVSPGAYHAIIKTNLRNNIRETTLDNNDNFSASPMIVDITPLTLGVPASIGLTAGESRYFKLAVAGEFDLSLDVSSTEMDATNEIFVAFDRAPTPGDFDFTGPPTFTSNPFVLIPSIQNGIYYILVRAASLPSGAGSETLTILARALPFSITSVTPVVIGSPGEVTLTVNGAGFRETTRIYLNFGGLRLPADREIFVNTTRMKGRFTLPPGVSGIASIEAENLDGSVVQLRDGIFCEPARALAVMTTPVRQDFVRNNAAAYFTFRYRNISNVDVPHFQARLIVPGPTNIVAVNSSPGFLRRSDRYPELFAPTAGDHVGLFNEAVNDSIRFLDFETAHLAPDEEVTVTLNVTNFPTSPFSVLSLTELSDGSTWLSREMAKIELARLAILDDPAGIDPTLLILAADPPVFRDEALLADHVANGLLDPHVVAELPDGPIQFAVDGDSPPPFIIDSGPGSQGDCSHPTEAPDCTSEGIVECALPPCLACFGTGLPLTLRLGSGLTVNVPGGTCGNYSHELCVDAIVVAPCDPNTLTGPSGFGGARWVGVSQPMLFTANFENLSGVATAPAQVVQVNLPLHSNLELSSFRLGSFGFGSHVIEVPPNRSSYTAEPYFSDLNLRVRITAGVDINARKAFWVFTSIDPVTGQVPANPQVGFLPVNDQFGRGQGFCNFTVKPAVAAATGAPIDMQAGITFDTNAPVFTNSTNNTIDSVKPASSIVGPPQLLSPNSIQVSWAGSDDATGSGLGTYDLYLQQNSGGFQLVTTDLVGTATTLTLQPGSAYGFYTIARDNSGNPELAKNAPEATINLGSGVGVPEAPPPPQYALSQNFPNPFQSATTVQFDLPVDTDVELQIFDVAGRLVASYLGGQRLPAGRHTLNLEAGSMGSGVYFYHLRAGEKLFTRKMLVVR